MRSARTNSFSVSTRQRNILIIISIATILPLLSILASNPQKRYYLNLSSSMPLGIYKITPAAALTPGDLVVFDPPEVARPYIYGRRWLPAGWPLIKQIGALAGDTFSIEGASFCINNKYIGAVYTQDGEGGTLPRITGIHTVKSGTFLPISPYSRSFDGRYFGAVPVSSIKGKATPLWYW
ncbi:MAG: S26 family signal peptidase [Syntrophobacterales bacterium]|jgi:conjugative transfer signal peptidase TraF|nr:S26 family signal peptidase [Syntrophobacterales bacterium]